MKAAIFSPFVVDRRSSYYALSTHLLNRMSLQPSRRMLSDLTVVAPSQSRSGVAETNEFYQKRLSHLQSGLTLALDERGEAMTSQQFAKLLQKHKDRGTRTVQFCLGGAYGLPQCLNQIRNLKLLRLSDLTLSHELAFVVLLEQLYRASMIQSGHPYHHGAPSDLYSQLAGQ